MMEHHFVCIMYWKSSIHPSEPQAETMTFPVFYLLSFFGLSKSSRSSRKLSWRTVLLTIYILLATVWFLLFSISTFYWQVSIHTKGRKLGEKDSSVIIRVLDDISWVSIMLRNIMVLAKFSFHAHRFYEISTEMEGLSKVIFEGRWEVEVQKAKLYSWRSSVVSFVTVTFCFVMLLTYWNRLDYSYALTNWAFNPFQFILLYWHVSVLMVIFVYIPFVMVQIILHSIISLGYSASQMMKHINGDLNLLGERYQNIVVEGTVCRNLKAAIQLPKSANIAELRFGHYKICRFADEISEKFSSILMTVVLLDLVSALGFVGLIIGYKGGPDEDAVFDRVYQVLAASLWMGYFLCAEYQPFISLHEQAEETYHWIHALSLAKSEPEFQREITHFLLATKNAHTGIIAGKLILFSRNMCATIISFLCSFGIILYEILHKDASGGIEAIIEHGILGSMNVTNLNSTTLLVSSDDNSTFLLGKRGSDELE